MLILFFLFCDNYVVRLNPKHLFFMSKSSKSSFNSLTQTTPMSLEVNSLNPRQYEVHDSQSTHQKTLNYIEFKARLESKTSAKPFCYDNYMSPSKLYGNNELEQDLDIQELELQLRKELEGLEEDNQYIKDKIKEANQALEEFHNEKKEQKKLREQKNVQSRKLYEEEIISLKMKIDAIEYDMKLSADESNYLRDSNAKPLAGFEKAFELRRKLAKTELESTNTKEILNKQVQSK